MRSPADATVTRFYILSFWFGISTEYRKRRREAPNPRRRASETAEIFGCAVATVKSRVYRARVTLAELLSIEDIDDFGPDQASRAAIAGTVGMSTA